MSSPTFIRCIGLHRSFRGVPVLRGLSLDVRRGETLVVLGGSGSGKSVLLKHMNGLLRPERGSVEIDGRPISELEEAELVAVRRKLGMLFQQGALFDSLSVGENVAYPLREHRLLPRAAIAERVREVLAMVELAGSEALLPAELSGGMRKRAALARALALQPEAVLYDEPTTGLDPVVGAKINRLIRDLQRRLHLTSVVVTHDLASAFFVADRIAFLDEGVIRFVGTPEEARATSDPRLREFLEAA